MSETNLTRFSTYHNNSSKVVTGPDTTTPNSGYLSTRETMERPREFVYSGGGV